MQNRMQEIMQQQAAMKNKYTDLRLEKLKQTTFHNGQYSLKWLQAAVDALQYATPVSMELPVREFVELCYIEVSEEEEISFLEIGMLCNNFEKQPRFLLGLTKQEYLDLLQENDAIAEKWNGYVAKWNAQFDMELEKELAELQKKFDNHMTKTMTAVPKAEA